MWHAVGVKSAWMGKLKLRYRILASSVDVGAVKLFAELRADDGGVKEGHVLVDIDTQW